MLLLALKFTPSKDSPMIYLVSDTIRAWYKTMGYSINFKSIYHKGKKRWLIFNPEAKERGFPANRAINGHLIFGTFFICDPSFEYKGVSIPLLTQIRNLRQEFNETKVL